MPAKLMFHQEESGQLRLLPARVARYAAVWFLVWLVAWPLVAWASGKPVSWIGTLVLAIWMACMMPAWMAWRERNVWERDRKLKSLEAERLAVVQSAMTAGRGSATESGRARF